MRFAQSFSLFVIVTMPVAAFAIGVGETLEVPARGDVDRDGLLTPLDVTEMVTQYQSGILDVTSEFDYDVDGVFGTGDIFALGATVTNGVAIPVEERDLLLGDLSGDGRVSLADLGLVFTAVYRPDDLEFSLDALDAGDIDRDGHVTESDAISILRYVEQLFVGAL